MRLFTILALIAIGTGAGLIGFSLCIPVYTDAEAPFRLSQELQSLPRELRFKEWDKQLPRYETAHKKLFDWG
ncbi:MAG: hypothetical protein ABIP97_00080, partial [Chthoniobacterales bacterium]